MRVFTCSTEHLREVCNLLLLGEVVGIPTETVYGLAADALNPDAVEKIYQIKGRPAHNPLIIHIGTPSSADRYVQLHPLAQRLMQAFWPGPLTLVLPKSDCIPSIVTAGLETVGIRCPRHPAMQAVLQQLDRPLAAPSANPSNYLSPTRVEHVVEHLRGRLDWVLDGGPCEAGLESTIVDLSDPTRPQLLRPGPLSIESIEAALGCSLIADPAAPASGGCTQARTSPGQLALHYSPHTPLRLRVDGEPAVPPSGAVRPIACIHFSERNAEQGPIPPGATSFFLSHTHDAQEAGRMLYALLQQLDRGGFEAILVDPIPEGNEWHALRDRLTRAAAR